MDTTPNTGSPEQAVSGLQRLVVKDGVHLGGLPAGQRALALGVVWATLPAAPMREADANRHLLAALAGPACWLDTDHVELRRWLVDTGWLARDGFGRAYECVPPHCLPATLQPLAALLCQLGEAATTAEASAASGVAAWVAAQRQQHEARRAERRQAWARQA